MIHIDWNPIGHLGPIAINWYGLFLTYLVLFSVLRFFVVFVRGNVPDLALELKNGQWTAAAILIVSLPMLMMRSRRARPVVGPVRGDN